MSGGYGGRGFLGGILAGMALLTAVQLPVWAQGADVPMPSPNAYDYFVQAGELSRTTPGRSSDYLPGAYRPEGQEPPTMVERKTFLKRKAAALKTLRLGFSFPYRNPPSRSFMTLFPEFAQFRELARTLFVESQVRAEEGDLGGAANSCLDAMQMGNEIPRGGILIAKLVGFACEGIGRKPLWELVERLDASQARSAVRRLERIGASRMPFAETLQEQRLSGVAATREALTEAIAEREKAEVSGEAVSSEPPLDVEETARDYDLYMSAVIEAMSHPYAEKRALPKRLDERFAAPYPEILGQARAKDEDAKMQNALLRVALALRAYRVEHRDYPSALGELVADRCLTRVPLDPFNISRPVRYRRLSAERYLLYSVGPDGIDEGGAPLQRKEDDASQSPLNFTTEGMTGDFVVGVNTPVPQVASRPR